MNGAFQEPIRDDSTLVYEVYEPVLRYVRISSVNQLRKFLLIARMNEMPRGPSHAPASAGNSHLLPRYV